MISPEVREHRARLDAKYRLKKGHRPRPTRPFAFQPVVDYGLTLVGIGTYVNSEVADVYRLLGINRHQAAGWRKSGLDCFTVDRLCVRLGEHPSAIYADWWATVEPEELDATG